MPFARGGAEIFADDLVAELRARDHEVDLVTVPYKWYPGERVLSQAFLWRLLDLERVGRAADRPRDRDEVPVVRGPPSEQGRLAPAPVPAGVRARPHRARPVRRKCRGARGSSRGAAPRRVALGEAPQAVRHLAQRRRTRTSLDRTRGRSDAASSAGAPVPDRELRRLRPQRRPSRPRKAARPPARRTRSRLDPAVRDRRRRSRPRPPGGRRSAARARRTGAFRRSCRRGGARRAVRALPRRLHGGRRLRHGSVRGIPRREARRDDDRRGRPARGRRRPSHRSRLRAARGRARRGVLLAARARRRREGMGGAGKEIAGRVSWDETIARLLA